MDVKKAVKTAAAVYKTTKTVREKAKKVSKGAKRAAFFSGALIGLAAVGAAGAAIIAPGKASEELKAPFMGKNIAHRGLHTEDKSVPENSIAAFRRAVEKGYGVELDVRLTKDGKVVVFHDDDLNRMCGEDRLVDELTFAELSEYRLCGTDEKIPLFSDVLVTINGKTPIICEVKTGRRNAELCEKTCKLISAYSGDICIESFDPTIVAWFRFKAPEILRGQLATVGEDYAAGGKSPLLGAVLENTLLNFAARPQFIAYKIGPRPLPVRLAETMGAMKVGWTSHDASNEKGRDTVIFEFYEPEVSFK